MHRLKKKATYNRSRHECEPLERRVLCAYSPVGPEIAVTANAADPPAIASDAAGDFVVAWAGIDGSNGQKIFAQLFSAGGSSSGPAFVVDSAQTQTQLNPAVAMNASGQFVIGWTYVISAANGVYAWGGQTFNAGGTPNGLPAQIDESNESSSSQALALAMGPDGNFEAAFGTTSGDSSTLYIQRCSFSGSTLGSIIQADQDLNTGSVGDRFYVAPLASNSSGNFAIAWTNNLTGSFFAEYTESGTQVISKTSTSGSVQNTGIAVDGSGNPDVLYHNSSSGLAVQQYNVSGTALHSAITILSSSYAGPTVISADSSGNFQAGYDAGVDVFTGQAEVTQNNVMIDAFSSSGKLTSQLEATGGFATARTYPALVDDGTGDLLLADLGSATSTGPVQAEIFDNFSSTSTISGNIWSDANANGLYDSGEAATTVSSVSLFNSYGTLVSTINSPNGSYLFNQVMPGQSVYVQVNPIQSFTSFPTGTLFTAQQFLTTPNVGSNPAVNSVFDYNTGIGPIVNLTSGQVLANQNAGIVNSATITGVVFNDLLSTGVKDTADPSVPGQQVYADLNQNGLYDAGEPTCLSNVSPTAGTYDMYLLRPGTYPITVAPIPGWTALPAVNAAVVSGQTLTLNVGIHESGIGKAPVQSGSTVTLAAGIAAPSVAINDSDVSVESYLANYPQTNAYFQRFDSTGAAVGSPVLIANTGSANNSTTSVAIAADGSFVIALDGSSGVYAQCFSASGTATGSLFNVDNGALGRNAVVEINAAGQFDISWYQFPTSPSLTQVYTRLYSSHASAISAPVLIGSVAGTPSTFPLSSAVRSDGSATVIWGVKDSSSGPSEVHVQSLDSTGALQGSEIEKTIAGDNDAYTTLAINPNGQFAVAWQASVGQQTGIYIQRFNPDGSALGNTTFILPNYYTSGIYKKIDIDSNGNVIGAFAGSNYAVGGVYLDINGGYSSFNMSNPASSSGYSYALATNSGGDSAFIIGRSGSNPSYGARYIAGPPTIFDAAFQATSGADQFALRVSNNITTPPTLSQIMLQDLTTGSTVPSSSLAVELNTDGTLWITFPGYAGGALSSGSYLLDIAAAGFSTSAGQTLSADFTYRFLWVAPVTGGDSVILRSSSDGTTVQLFDQIPEGSTPSYSAAISTLNQFNILGGPANDLLQIDLSTTLYLPKVGLFYDGQGGTNTIQTINSASLTFTPTSITFGRTGTMTYANVQNLIDGLSSSSSLAVSGAVTVQFPAPAAGSGIVIRKITSLTIGTGSQLKLLSQYNIDGSLDHADRMLLNVSLLSLTGLIDAGDNDLIAPITSTYPLLFYSEDLEPGVTPLVGIFSSVVSADPTHLSTFGVIQSTGTTFDGQTTTASSALLKYTYFGDATFDGKIDGSDYTRIDSGFLTHATGWYNGDFNYDGVINGSDYTLIDNAFNNQGASLAALVGSSQTHLPTSSPVRTAVPQNDQVVTADDEWFGNKKKLTTFFADGN